MDPRAWRIRGTRRAAAPEGKGIRCDGIPFPNTSDVYDVDEGDPPLRKGGGRALEVLLVGRLGLASRVRRSDARTLGGRSGSGRLVEEAESVAGAVNARAICAAAPRMPETPLWTWNRSFDTLHATGEALPWRGVWQQTFDAAAATITIDGLRQDVQLPG
jgi:hypothetical protein